MREFNIIENLWMAKVLNFCARSQNCHLVDLVIKAFVDVIFILTFMFSTRVLKNHLSLRRFMENRSIEIRLLSLKVVLLGQLKLHLLKLLRIFLSKPL